MSPTILPGALLVTYTFTCPEAAVYLAQAAVKDAVEIFAQNVTKDIVQLLMVLALRTVCCLVEHAQTVIRVTACHAISVHSSMGLHALLTSPATLATTALIVDRELDMSWWELTV